eukprot:scaffold108705_cov22-Tisochrysis_lutea.AAC.4
MEGSRAWQSRDCFLYGIGVSLAFNIFVGGAAIVIQPWLAGLAHRVGPACRLCSLLLSAPVTALPN